MNRTDARRANPSSPNKVRWFGAGLGLTVAALFIGGTTAGAAAAVTPQSTGSGAHHSPATAHSSQGGSSSKWDSIVAGEWDVPAANLESYEVGADSSQRILVAFENYYVFTIHNGTYTGNTQSYTQEYVNGSWTPPVALPAAVMSGSISPAGAISMTITPDSSKYGVSYASGHMIFIGGQWRMTMQTDLSLNRGGTPYIVQWANMTKLLPGQAVLGSADGYTTIGNMTNMSQSANPLDSPQYAWLAGTNWTERDSLFEGGKAEPFKITCFSNGTFFGASTGTDKFWVSGNVAPNGSVFLVFTTADRTIVERSGWLTGQGVGRGAKMAFSSFSGAAAYGVASQTPGRTGGLG